MDDTEARRERFFVGELIKALRTKGDHADIGCKCPVRKARMNIVSSLLRVSKQLDRLDELEKKEQARLLIGVKPPCKE